MTNEVLQKIASDEQNISSSNGLEPSLRFTGFYENWHEKYIKDVADVIGGGTPDTTKLEYWNGNIQWFTPTEIGHNKYVNKSKRTITEKGLKNSSAKLLPPKTILLTSRATIGECSIIEKECATNQGFQSLVPNSLINNEFCYYLINTKKKELLRKASGSTFLEISNSEIKQIKCKFPSLLEQQKIADFLFLVDRRIEKQRQLVESLKKYKRGLFFEIFEQKRRFKDGNNKFYPKWEKKSLGTIFKERTERAIGNEELLSVTINSGVKKRCEVDVKDNSSDDKSKYKKLYPNDIAYNTMRMWQGASGVSLYEGIVSPAYTVITTIIPVKIGFFGYYFKYIKTIQIFQKFSQGLTSDTWNLKYPQLSEIQLLIPNIEEQEKIYETFKFLDDKILLSENTLNLLQDIKKGLLQKMFI